MSFILSQEGKETNSLTTFNARARIKKKTVGNELIGQIPPEISQLRFLQYLALNGNCLYGTIPAEFGDMPNLLSLELHGNGLSGEVPKEIYSASKLQLLNVAMQFQYAYTCTRQDGSRVNTLYAGGDPANGYNWGLQGKILGPDVATWRSMKGLHIFSNSFDGTIADEIGDLKYLGEFFALEVAPCTILQH